MTGNKRPSRLRIAVIPAPTYSGECEDCGGDLTLAIISLTGPDKWASR